MTCICDMCNGTGYVKEASNSMDYPYVKKCPKCRGGGYKVEQEPMTNNEWRKTCSAEEFAEEMTKVVLNIVSWNNDPKPSEVRHILKSWLKQPHREE